MKNKDKIKENKKENIEPLKINIKGACDPIKKKFIEFKLAKKKINYKDLL